MTHRLLHLRQRRGAFLAVGTCLAVSGIVAGAAAASIWLPAAHSGDQGRSSVSSDQPTSPVDIPEILHNPPLIYKAGESVSLRFDLACAGTPCGPATSTLTILDGAHSGAAWREKGEVTDSQSSFSFDVPDSITNQDHFFYRLDAELADGRTRAFPSEDPTSTMEAVAAKVAQKIEIKSFDTSSLELPGTELVSGTWGTGPDQFGRSSESGSGPRSFDISATENLVIADRYNDRFVMITPEGDREILPATFKPGEIDIAIEPNGMIDVLYANGGGKASLAQFAGGGGKAVAEIPLATSSADYIRRVGDFVLVAGADSWWFPVSRQGQLVDLDQQSQLAQPGLMDRDSLVIRKHLRDRANEVWVAERTGQSVRSWRLLSQESLGPIKVASPLPDGRVLVVQSQFSNETNRYVVLVIDGEHVDQYTLPDDDSVDTYVNLRLVGTSLYQARASDAEYSIWKFDLAKSRP